MRKIDVQIFVHQCAFHELNESERNLLVQAQRACAHSYAPYSQFHVGAAVFLDDGTVVVGSNQENAAFPSGLCAERTAIFAAGSNYPANRIIAVAIAAHPAASAGFVPVSPCGACRQAMLEYEYRQRSPIRIIMQGSDDALYVAPSVATLLPLQFSGANLPGG